LCTSPQSERGSVLADEASRMTPRLLPLSVDIGKSGDGACSTHKVGAVCQKGVDAAEGSHQLGVDGLPGSSALNESVPGGERDPSSLCSTLQSQERQALSGTPAPAGVL